MVGSDHFHQLFYDTMPQFLIGEMPQHNGEPIMGTIGLTTIHSCDLFQRPVGLSHPVAHRQLTGSPCQLLWAHQLLAVQPRLSPLLQPMPPQMVIQDSRQVHLLHQGQEHHTIIDALAVNL